MPRTRLCTHTPDPLYILCNPGKVKERAGTNDVVYIDCPICGAERKKRSRQRAAERASNADDDLHDSSLRLALMDPQKIAAKVMHDRGYVIMSGVLSDKMRRALLKLQPEGWEDAEGGLLGPDPFVDAEASRAASGRKSHDLDLEDQSVNQVIAHVRLMLEEAGLLSAVHVSSSASLLLAKAGAPQQGTHLDFHKDPELYKELSTAGEVPYPVSILFALEAGTRVVLNGREMEIPVGGCAVWKGDLPHAGAAYTDRNVRFHLYFGVRTGAGRRTRRVDPPRGTGGELVLVNPDAGERPRRRRR